ncbi:MAG: tetraacyldisaccharide 4'-kinase [Candidatus Riflebacteria bacterium]|nr:tetraacyldisaccharide 4'-kinase [Candidatus Riflebacteria bacterium]
MGIELLQKLLSPLEPIYAGLSKAERLFFEKLDFLTFQTRAKVISIGNLSSGGTGKTPFLLEMLTWPCFPARKVVLTRGYKSSYERSFFILYGKEPHIGNITDEALLVNLHFPGIPVLMGKNRFHSARMAEKLFSPEIIFLDDGFQYRRLRKDFEIVLWDSNDDPENVRLIPAGRFREPLSRLSHSDLLVLTKCDEVSSDRTKFLMSFFNQNFPQLTTIKACTKVSGMLDCTNLSVLTPVPEQKYFAFCAIATPDSFIRILESVGGKIQGKRFFPDHYNFTTEDLISILTEAENLLAVPVCTEKDFVKIPRDIAKKMQLQALLIRTEVADFPYDLLKKKLGTLAY